MLLASKADVTCHGYDGTALHYAICKGSSHTSIIKLLLENAANPFVQNGIERNPLQEAMAEHMYDVVDIMRQMAPWSGIVDVKVSSVNWSKEEEKEEEVLQESTKSLVVLEPIFRHCSVSGGYYQLVAYKDERDMVGRRLELEWDAWEWEQPSVYKLQLEDGRTKFSLTFNGPSPSDNRAVLAAVLKSIKWASNVQGQIMGLGAGCWRTHQDKFEPPDASSLGVLLHSLPVPQYLGEWQAIDNAVLYGYIMKDDKRCADMLVRCGADVHGWMEFMEFTTLHVAAEGVALGKRDTSCVELLLHHGASPFISDWKGRTPLDCFVFPTIKREYVPKGHDWSGSEADNPQQMQATEDSSQCSDHATPYLPPHPYSAKLMSEGALWQGKVALKVAKDGVQGYLTRRMAVVPHFVHKDFCIEPAGKKLYIYKEGTEGELVFGQQGTGSVCTGDGAKCLWTENMTLVLPSEGTQHLAPDLESCMSQDEGGQLKLVLRPASRDGADLAALRTALDTPCLPPTARRRIPFHPSFWKETPPPAHGCCVVCQKAPSVAWLVHEDTAHKSLCEGCAAQRATAGSTACPVCCKPVLQVLAKLP
ncbi:hypothetical protein V8C86DRAFT_2652778 [Haematococcus lacustris]